MAPGSLIPSNEGHERTHAHLPEVVKMTEAYACDAIRTPFGRYRGALKDLRADDLGAAPTHAPGIATAGGAIAHGHPPGASDARLVTTALHQFERTQGHYARCTMCIGVGQGTALAIERL